MALAPIHKKYGIKKAIISTYQAASGAGAPGMQELKVLRYFLLQYNKIEYTKKESCQ